MADPQEDPFNQLSDQLLNDVGRQVEQLPHAIAILTEGQSVIASHHERVEGKWRVTVLTDKALFEVEADDEPHWRGGHLTDDKISVRAWRHQDIERVTPRVIHLHWPQGEEFASADFERIEVSFRGSDELVQIPAANHPDQIGASQELRRRLLRAWLDG